MYAKILSISFCKVLNSLYQQELLPKEKKDHLLKEWEDAIQKADKEKVNGLIKEIEPLTDGNNFLIKEIEKMKEEKI